METAETNIRKEQFGQEKDWKAKGKETRDGLKDINMAEAFETNIRKEQHEREKESKATSRETVQKNADVNIAKAFYS